MYQTSGTLPNDSERSVFPPLVKLLAIGTCIATLFSNNGIYLSFSLLTFFILSSIFLKERRPGILMFIFSMQWIQVVAYVLWVNFTGSDITRYSPSAGTAVILGNLGLLAIAFVIKLCIQRLKLPSWNYLIQEAAKVNEKRLLLVYMGSTLFLGSIGFIFGNTSPIAQVLLNIANIKWVFLLWLAFVLWLNKKHRMWLLFIVMYEFTSGLFSYFSSFKEVLLYTVLFSFTFIKRITLKQFIGLIVGGVVLSILFVTWSAIKSDYREFLNKGSRQQTINVKREEAFSQLGDQLVNLDEKRYQGAIYYTLYRVQYIYHFAIAIDRVPTIIPYQNGAVWWGNISFVFMPRILFPEKKIYDATVKTVYFTGINYAGYKQGAAFSFGYFPDCYVDFGPIGMFIPLIFIGLYVSLIYYLFFKRSDLPVLLRYSVINVVLYEFKAFESDGLFIVGRLLSLTVVYYFLMVTIFPLIVRWLTETSRKHTALPVRMPAVN